MDVHNSFRLGWNYGRRHRTELTARQIQTLFPNVNLDAFAQGNIDGVLNDRFRLDWTPTK